MTDFSFRKLKGATVRQVTTYIYISLNEYIKNIITKSETMCTILRHNVSCYVVFFCFAHFNVILQSTGRCREQKIFFSNSKSFIYEPSSTIHTVSEPQVVEMFICMKRHKHLSVSGAVMKSLSILMLKTTFAVICGFEFPGQLKQTFGLRCLRFVR